MKWWQHIPLSWGAHVHEDLVFVHHRTNKSTFVKSFDSTDGAGHRLLGSTDPQKTPRARTRLREWHCQFG